MDLSDDAPDIQSKHQLVSAAHDEKDQSPGTESESSDETSHEQPDNKEHQQEETSITQETADDATVPEPTEIEEVSKEVSLSASDVTSKEGHAEETAEQEKSIDEKDVEEKEVIEQEEINIEPNKYLLTDRVAPASTGSVLSMSTDSSLQLDLSVLSQTSTQPPEGCVTQKVEVLEELIAANAATKEDDENASCEEADAQPTEACAIQNVEGITSTHSPNQKEVPEAPIQATNKEEFVTVNLVKQAELDDTSATDLEHQALDPVREEVQKTVESITRSYKKTKEKRQQRRCILTLAVIALVMTVAIIVVPVFLIGRDKEDSTNNIQVSNEANDDTTKNVATREPMETDAPAEQVSSAPNSTAIEMTTAPTKALTDVPTSSPIAAPTTAEPSAGPTAAPTMTNQLPDSELLQAIKAVLVDPEPLQYSSTSHFKAYIWMTADGSFVDDDMDKMIQRYVVTLLYFSAQEGGAGPSFADASLDECDWYGVKCDDNDMVTELVWANQNLQGVLPEDIRLLAPDLKHLDLAENSLYGELPEGLWELTELEYLYLHQNQFTGTLSESVANLQDLNRLYLGDNNLSGKNATSRTS